VSDQKTNKDSIIDGDLRKTLNKVGQIFEDFKGSYQDQIIKNGSTENRNPEDLSEEDLERIVKAAKKLEDQLKNLNI